MTRDLDWLNSLTDGEATNAFTSCCGSRRWVAFMVSSRPFKDRQELNACAERAWWELGDDDWLQAFQSHPKIGETKAKNESSTQGSAWSEQEQAGVRQAARPTIETLAALNQQYEKKFGYIFIICATGKSPEEMLAILRRRLENAPDEELCIAAREQMKITDLRLKKMLS